MKAIPANEPARVLVVGRSPSVLLAAVDLLRAKGYAADATNQFDQVLDDYDVSDLDVLVFGGMVPADTKQHLRDETSRRNNQVIFVQGLAGIAEVIAAQVEAVTYGDPSDAAEIGYVADDRTLRIALSDPAHVVVEASWAASFKPPEPTSASLKVFDGELSAGAHDIVLPDDVPSEACWAAVTVGRQVRVVTVGGMPDAVTRMVPTSAADRRLPDVTVVATHSDDR